MRLLEMQRSALGLAPRDTAWVTRFMEGALPGPDEEIPVDELRSAMLAVELSATPSSGVIPGAVVTLALSVANEGAAQAERVLVAAPLPGGAVYRDGSFVQNGRRLPDELAERFFGEGLAIEHLAAGERAGFVWKVSVRLGGDPLVVAPQIRAPGVAIVGARHLTITRRAQTTTAFAAEVAKPSIPAQISVAELPIYELDEEEQLVYEAADAALSPARARDDISHPDIPSAVEGRTDRVEPPREAVVRYGRFDRPTLAFFERTFSGTKPPTILQHCIFAGAIACTGDGGGDGAELKRHLDAQSQVLHRIALHEKLGKKEPIGEYKGELLAQLDRLQPAPVAPLEPSPQALVLEVELSVPTLSVIAKIAEERDRWDFVKARQLTLALQAQRALVESEAAGAAIENALRHYAQVSMTTLQKLFVRIRLDRTTGILFSREPSLDAAARTLLATFRQALEP
jgi:hypothetical protein